MKRLELLVDLVDEGKVVADIGTDHGITAIEVYEKKSPKKVIATDISSKSLKKLEDKILNYGYEIETIVTDGIKDLVNYSLDNIIISGMGGYLISEILERGYEVARSAEKLILQPNNSLKHLRAYLHKRGFEIEDEYMVYEDRIYYNIILARYKGLTPVKLEDFNYEFGQSLINKRDPILRSYLKNRLEILTSIKNSLEDKLSQSSKKRKDDLDKEIKRIEEVLVCF